MKKLILIKTQQNFFDIQSRFAGWYDVGLTQKGIKDSKQIASILKQNNIKVDYAFLSVLLRAEQTYTAISKELGYKIRNFKSWKINDRHLGLLQGLSHEKAKEMYGEDIVDKLKLDNEYLPPKLDESDLQNPNNDELYSMLKESMPLAETLNDVYDRSINYLTNFILQTVKPNQTAIIVADEQVLQCFQHYLCKVTNILQKKHTQINEQELLIFEILDI